MEVNRGGSLQRRFIGELSGTQHGPCKTTSPRFALLEPDLRISWSGLLGLWSLHAEDLHADRGLRVSGLDVGGCSRPSDPCRFGGESAEETIDVPGLAGRTLSEQFWQKPGCEIDVASWPRKQIMVTRSRGLCGTCLVLDLFLLAIVCPCECSLKCNHMRTPS